MTVRVLALVFLFILKLRYPANKPVAEIIRKTYGTDAVKWLRRFEILILKFRKMKPIYSFCKVVIRKD